MAFNNIFRFSVINSIPLIALLFLGYRFIVRNEIIWFILNVFIEIGLLVFFVVKKENPTKTADIISQLLPLFSLIYVCAIGLIIDGMNAIILVMHAFICFMSCFIISILYRNERSLKAVCAVLNSVLLLFLLWNFFMVMTFGQIGENTIVKQVSSPNKIYTAILINSDQGALGGDTLVDVEYTASKTDIWFSWLIKIKKSVYAGEWGEFETMSLEWKDDNTLLINSSPYSMD